MLRLFTLDKANSLSAMKRIHFNGNAKIKLYGAPTDETLAYSVGIEGGNKVLAVLGTAKLYGEKRDRMTRLKATCRKDDITAQVSTGLDWQIW